MHPVARSRRSCDLFPYPFPEAFLAAFFLFFFSVERLCMRVFATPSRASSFPTSMCCLLMRTSFDFDVQFADRNNYGGL